MNGYWTEWNQIQDERGERDGRLGVRIMYPAQARTLTICWYRRQRINTTKGSRVQQIYIEKGTRKDRYNEARIRRVARNWELDLYRKYEDEFEKIRRRTRHFGKLRKHLHNTQRVLASDNLMRVEDVGRVLQTNCSPVLS